MGSGTGTGTRRWSVTLLILAPNFLPNLDVSNGERVDTSEINA